jgi:hypothetical protein
VPRLNWLRCVRRFRAQGKTTEAQADLARLSLIKAQREEAAKKRAEEKAAADAKKASGAKK